MRRWPLVAVRTAAARSWNARGPLLVSYGFYAIVATVLSTLWRLAAEAHGGNLVGYRPAQLVWYIYASEAAISALNPRQIELTGDDIVSGAVAVEMLRPASVVGVRIATEVGRSLPRLLGCIVIGAVVATLTVGGPPDAVAALLAVPALGLAAACNLAAQHAFAAASFWIRDSRSAWFLYQKLVFIVGGMLLPLQVLPGWLHRIAALLPFAAMAYAPARLASGHLEPWLLVEQTIWLVALIGLAVAVFTAGERKLQVVGG